MGTLGAIVDFVANLMGFARKRQDLANSPEQQANAAAKTDQQIKDDARAAIAKGDVERVRKLAAE